MDKVGDPYFDTSTTPGDAGDDPAADSYGLRNDLRLAALSGQLHYAGSQLSEPEVPSEPTLPVKRGPGRPRGRNYTKVSVFLDEKTIAHYDAIAEKHHISRSEAIRQQLLPTS